MNNKNRNKITTFKTLLILSITSMMLIPGGIIQAHAVPGDLLLTINNPVPNNDDSFGFAIASTPDGNLLIGAQFDDIGATNAGSAYLYDEMTGNLLLTMNNPIPSADELFGRAVAATPNGNLLIGVMDDNTGATRAGVVHLIDDAGNLLLTINNPTPEYQDRFGIAVATTINGNLLVGAHGDDTGAEEAGSVYIYDGITGNLLRTINNPTPGFDDKFGFAITSTPDGNILIGALGDDTGAQWSGSAYLYDGITGNLLLTINNPTPAFKDFFGESVAATPNGNLLVGAYWDDTGADNAGSAYLFNGTDGNLLLTINNPEPNVDDEFGYDVASTDNGYLLIGARYDDTGASNAGSAYLFDGVTGNLLLTINNPTPTIDDYFGESVTSTDIGNLLIGAHLDDTGASNAGSAYLFEGIPTLYCGQPESYYNVINGTESPDYLIGTNSPDLIFGNGGNDIIYAMGEDNCIYAGDGNDFVLANKDSNTVYGGAGDDSIQLKGTGIAYGEDGDDSIYIIKPIAGHLIDGGNDYDLCVANGNTPINTIHCELVAP